MTKELHYYLKIWLRLTLNSFQVAFVSRFGATIFTFAKFLRFGLFMLVVILVVTQTQSLAGYTLAQSLVFFLTYNVIDSVTQLFFRDVYRFREKIVSGDFDLILIKPVNPLFRVLLGGADPLDLVVIVPYVLLLIFFISPFMTSVTSIFYYLVLMLNGFLIAAAFHVAVLALGIITTEIDHAIMIYRDITSMARFPVDIYSQPLRSFITFIIPIGIMMTFPPKALFGLLSFPLFILSGGIGVVALIISIRLWRYSLSRYSSASS